MASKQSYLTQEGEAELLKELRNLIDIERPALARKLKAAVAQGDLKENADYHDAKERQGFLEGRIQQIEAVLRNAIVIANTGPSEMVMVGSTVVIREIGEADDEEYKIVGSAEANLRERKISSESPIGSALMGKKKGQRVAVDAPDGRIKFKIIAVR